MKHLFDRYLFNPHWRTIKVFGQAKVLGISATTIIVAPMLSRSLIKLNEMETTIRQSHPALDALFPLIQYHFALPLSIKLLMGSALCALFGKGLYEMACPAYIKAGDTHEAFRHSQARATDILLKGVISVALGGDLIKKSAMIKGLAVHNVHIKGGLEMEHIDGNTPVEFVAAGRITRSGMLAFVLGYPEISQPLFYVLRDVMDDSRHPARVACALLYGVAFALLSVALAIQLGWAGRGMLL